MFTGSTHYLDSATGLAAGAWYWVCAIQTNANAKYLLVGDAAGNLSVVGPVDPGFATDAGGGPFCVGKDNSQSNGFAGEICNIAYLSAAPAASATDPVVAHLYQMGDRTRGVFNAV